MEIDYNDQAQTLEISLKVFADDLEKTLEKQGAIGLNIGYNNEHEKTDLYIERYLKNTFTLEVNGEVYDYKFLGKQVEFNDTWCFIEAENVPQIESLSIENTIFMEMFDEQINLIHVRVGEQQKSLRLTRRKPQKELTFE